MSLSNILLSKNPVAPQPWTNLTANSITANFPVIAAELPSVAPTAPVTPTIQYAIGAADTNITNGGVLFNFAPTTSISLFNYSPTSIYSANFPLPASGAAGNGAIVLQKIGLYNVTINLPLVETVTTNSGSNFTLVLKISVDNGASFTEIFQSEQQSIAPATAATFSMIKSLNITVPNTQLQFVFKRTSSATSAGSVAIPQTAQSILRIIKVL